MWPALFALGLTAGVAFALLSPASLAWIQVDANYSLGIGCFFLGLGTSVPRFKDLAGTSLGLGNIAFSLFIGTFVWLALGLAAAVLALQYGLPFEVVVGLALLASCPVGGPSNAVNVHNAGGSLECSVLMCFLSTPAALVTFPYAYRHFLLLLLDQPLPPAASAAAAAAAAEVRAHLLSGPSALHVPPSVMAGILNHALFAACVPLAAGAVLSALLPGRLGAAARQVGPAAAASMIVLTASTKTAANAAAVAAAGAPVVVAVVALHVAALAAGYFIPAGVGAPEETCRTTALQASMRNPALGLGLAAALFGGSPHFPLLAAPCIISIFVQNTLGAWVALAGSLAPPSPLEEGAYGGPPMSPRTGRVLSADGILRQPTYTRSFKGPGSMRSSFKGSSSFKVPDDLRSKDD